ncbi:hypothetical protein EV702DRAFT_1196142 [Suillus placidus]|uniref:Uncharacterized protein n=1 Tax=Suillus placidus TaxID=48579 RepID=A0A9P6ZXM8_9AGAM|nr:hypothetical protein EV702DRAFT_1196142 [Suillus placidus]
MAMRKVQNANSQQERDRLNRLQMTSPARRNHRHAAHNNQEMPLPPWGLFHNLLHGNLPLISHINLYWWDSQYPGLPRNAIAHVQRAHALPPVDYNAHLNDQMNAAQNNRCCQCDVRRRQDRNEIRQQAQAELAGMQPLQQPHIPNEPIQFAPPAPPVYGAIHYEDAVGPHNFDNLLHYFAPNPAPPCHAPPEPDYHQFNIQFQHHFQEEQVVENERVRNDLLQRQAQDEFHQQQLQ